MKQYSKLYSFGCSFTEGGGLNTKSFQRYLNGERGFKFEDEPNGLVPENVEYAKTHSYPGYLSRLLNCNFENYGSSGSSNEEILNKVYNTISNLSVTDNILVTIQASMLSRLLIQRPDQSDSISINTVDHRECKGNLKKYFELYITEFFDDTYACKKLLQQVDVFTAWLTSKNIDVQWLFYELPNSEMPYEKHIVDLGGKTLKNFVYDNDLVIEKLPDFPYLECHFSPYGNQVIANKIYEQLKKL